MIEDSEQVFGDDRDGMEREPWLTAGDIIAGQGLNAELFVIQWASRLIDEGNIEDAGLLASVFEAIVLIRATEILLPPRLLH